MRLDAPADPALDPFDLDIADLSLVATAGDEVVFEAKRHAPDRTAGVDFGRIPAVDGVRLELFGETASGRVVGYGQSAPVDVTAEDQVEARIAFRRPFAYTAGNGALLAIDTTSEPGPGYAVALDDAGDAVSAVTSLPGGELLVAVVDGAVQRVRTTDHGLEGDAIPLAGPAVDLAASPSGRFAVVAHREMDLRGVSIVDLESGTATFVAAAFPQRVAVTDDTAWVLDGLQSNLFCSGTTRVLALDLADPTTPAVTDFPTPATDLVADPTTGAVVVAVPCANEVAVIDAPGAPARPLFDVDGASAVALARGQVWAMGHVDEDDAHLILAHAPLSGGDAQVLAMPTIEERAVATALANTGQDGLLRMTADLAAANQISVLPDGEHVAILLTAGYITEPTGDDGAGGFVVPKLTMITVEYQLVQLATGLQAQRLRLSCAIQWEPGALLDDFACARAPGQDESPVPLLPRNLTTTFAP